MIRRARPLLGTMVEIRADGDAALGAIEDAFDEIAWVHRTMSFHDRDSDVARINRALPGAHVEVDPGTAALLALALEIAAASGGLFDPTVAPLLVDAGLLPRPVRPRHDGADWRDIELVSPCTISLRRALWIDLGGIAKGYAVDLAVESLRRSNIARGCVNAGGDLRVFGDTPETVHIRRGDGEVARLLELSDGAIATSAPFEREDREDASAESPHVDGRTRRFIAAPRAVSVLAPRAVLADALTKVVLADPLKASPVLARYGATALLHDEIAPA